MKASIIMTEKSLNDPSTSQEATVSHSPMDEDTVEEREKESSPAPPCEAAALSWAAPRSFHDGPASTGTPMHPEQYRTSPPPMHTFNTATPSPYNAAGLMQGYFPAPPPRSGEYPRMVYPSAHGVPHPKHYDHYAPARSYSDENMSNNVLPSRSESSHAGGCTCKKSRYVLRVAFGAALHHFGQPATTLVPS
jgi:hypothetical protein